MMHRNAWVVQYDVEEKPTYEVCRHCVLPWEPLSGSLQARIDKEWRNGHIVDGVNQETVNFAVSDGNGGHQEQKIESWRIRRVQPSLLLHHDETDHEYYSQMSFVPGQPVWSRWYSEEGVLDTSKWFAATIVAYERDYDTYVVVYSDGDEASGIPPQYIRVLSYKSG